MSLINEALKKAQTDRPGSSRPEVPMGPGNGPPAQKPPRKKRYLLGFVLSVLVVGLISALLSTYLVFQLVGGDDKPGQQASDTPVEATPVAVESQPLSNDNQPQVAQVEPEEQEPDPEAVAETPDADKPEQPKTEENQSSAITLAEEQQPVAEELVITVPEAVESEPANEPAPVTQDTEPEPVATAEPPEPKPDPEPEPVSNSASAETNPQIWRRLDDFEIRGIMSGGAKVLIYDGRSERARTYTTGDLIDGALSLRIGTISRSEIQFTNNEGTIFTKVF